MFFCRHADTICEAFRVNTSYMPPTTGATYDPYTTTVQWSRRFIGLKLFLSLAHYGEAGYAEMIDRQVRMGELLRQSLQTAGWRVVNKTPLPLVCFTRDGLNTSDLLAKLYERQIAWISEVRLAGGPPVLRACISSYRTTEADIEFITREMTKLVS